MPRLRIDPDRETYDRLVELASTERRPVGWQAEVVLRQAVGLPFPVTIVHGDSADRQPAEAVS